MFAVHLGGENTLTDHRQPMVHDPAPTNGVWPYTLSTGDPSMSSHDVACRAVQIPEPLALDLEEEAREDRRTLDDQVTWILEKHRGAKKAQTPPFAFGVAKARRR
jgi:hypothetical protein